MDSTNPQVNMKPQSGTSNVLSTVRPLGTRPIAKTIRAPDFSPSSVWASLDVKELPVGIVGLHTVLILTAAYLLFGLIGRDPWKPDEAYAVGIVYDFLSTPDGWVVPTLAGEPFMEKPPLLYWVAAAFARVFSAWMPLHDAARLAAGFFMAITCAATGWVARYWWGKGYGRVAVLALLGCVGLLMRAQMLTTDVPLLTGFAIATCGIALAGSRPLAGGLLLGTGVGVGFLAKGLIAPGVIGITWALLLIVFPAWRTRNVLLASAVSVLAVLPWVLIWPVALYLRSPALFMDWFWLNNVGRFVGFSVPNLGEPNVEGFWWQTILWFTFPAFPLAVVTLWRFRARLPDTPPIQVCLLLSLVITAVLGLSASARANYFLPLLIPICLLAPPGASRLNAATDKSLDWTAKVVFGLFAIFLWAVWIVMVVRGSPPALPILSRLLSLDFTATFSPVAFVLAIILTLSAVIAMWKLPAQPRALTSWVVGITLVWGLLSTLWLPWIDNAKSHRAVFESMKPVLGTGYNCVSRTGLGESERGMLHYVAHVITIDKRNSTAADCDYWLYQGFAIFPPKDVDPQQWTLVWEGARPSDAGERFFLFKAAHARIVNN